MLFCVRYETDEFITQRVADEILNSDSICEMLS